MVGRRSMVLLWILFMAVTSVWAQDCVSIPEGIVGWWPGDGDARDLIGGNDGRMVGDVTFEEAVVHQGFVLNGLDSYIEIPDSPRLRPAQLTVMAWVAFDSLDTPGATLPGLQYILFKKNTRSVRFEGYSLAKLRIDGADRFVFTIASAAGEQFFLISKTVAQVGSFYHLAGTYDGSTVKLYVNGYLEDWVHTISGLDYDTKPLFIGTSGEPALLDGKLQGVVDEVSLYHRALLTPEIQRVVAAGSAGMCLPEK